jgi:hypothetical protein
MKFLKSLLMVGLVLTSLSASAQMDLFGGPRVVILEPPTVLSVSAATFDSTVIDTHGYIGVANVIISSCTNAGGALTVQGYTSPDTTNWTALANYANAVSTSVSYTNSGAGYTNYVTQSYLLPGTLTTPTAGTAGFATSYLNPSPFTNSSALTITTKGTYSIGYTPGDNARYLKLTFTPTGSSSNDIVSAVFIGRRSSEVK